MQSDFGFYLNLLFHFEFEEFTIMFINEVILSLQLNVRMMSFH